MKNLRVAIQARISSLVCDRCGTEVDAEEPGAGDFLSVDRVAGYGSVFGDGAKVELDLCDACIQEVLGQWIRVTDSPAMEQMKAFDPARHGGEFPAEPVRAKLHQSRPHEEAVVASFARDPEFAEEYMRQVLHDGDIDEVRLAIRRLAVCGLLNDSDASYLLRGLVALKRGAESEFIPADEVFARLAAKAASRRSAGKDEQR